VNRTGEPSKTPVVDPGAAYFSRLGAIVVGVACAVGFLSRGEELLVSVVGAFAAFVVGASWVLANGRLRRWLLFGSGWPQQVQTITFVLSFIGIPIAIVGGFQFLYVR